MSVLMYHPTLFASTFTSRRNLIISFWYAVFAFERGAAAARFWMESWWASAAAASGVGKAKEFVTSRVPFWSMPTMEPAAVVGNVWEQCLTIFMTTRASTCTAVSGLVPLVRVLALCFPRVW